MAPALLENMSHIHNLHSVEFQDNPYEVSIGSAS